jgi:hypothetical protein
VRNLTCEYCGSELRKKGYADATKTKKVLKCKNENCRKTKTYTMEQLVGTQFEEGIETSHAPISSPVTPAAAAPTVEIVNEIIEEPIAEVVEIKEEINEELSTMSVDSSPETEASPKPSGLTEENARDNVPFNITKFYENVSLLEIDIAAKKAARLELEMKPWTSQTKTETDRLTEEIKILDEELERITIEAIDAEKIIRFQIGSNGPTSIHLKLPETIRNLEKAAKDQKGQLTFNDSTKTYRIIPPTSTKA